MPKDFNNPDETDFKKIISWSYSRFTSCISVAANTKSISDAKRSADGLAVLAVLVQVRIEDLMRCETYRRGRKTEDWISCIGAIGERVHWKICALTFSPIELTSAVRKVIFQSTSNTPQLTVHLGYTKCTALYHMHGHRTKFTALHQMYSITSNAQHWHRTACTAHASTADMYSAIWCNVLCI